MSEKTRDEGRDYARFLESLPLHVRAATNQRIMEDAHAEHHKFQTAFRDGDCYACGGRLDAFNAQRPCLHWLLKPVGFTKHHFMAVTARYGVFQLQSYLRWVANEETFARNINDLADEGTGKLIELTITWRDCEWGFSCSEGDYRGHDGGKDGSDRPHYHFQMRHKKQAFIRYNDFHIPLRDRDVHSIEAMRALPGVARPMWFGGEGMSDVLSDETVEHIVKGSKPTLDEGQATFRMQTIIMADEGTTISGDELNKLFQEAREKGVTVASLVDKLPNVRAETFVMPGDGVAEQAPRSGGRKRKRDDTL